MDIGDYITSPKALVMFHPKKDEIVVVCLICRISILSEGTINNKVLKVLYNSDDNTTISHKTMMHLRMKVIYLRKAYKLAIQIMNITLWQEYCQLCIESFADNGTAYCKSKLSIMKWNRKFRTTDQFDIPFSIECRELKLFQFFPEAKKQIIQLCFDGGYIDSCQVSIPRSMSNSKI